MVLLTPLVSSPTLAITTIDLHVLTQEFVVYTLLPHT